MPEAWLHIGRVAAVQAARRRVRIRPTAGCDAEFANRKRIWLACGAQTPRLLRVAAVQDAGAEKIVELTPGVSRDMVAGFANADVLIPAAESNRDAPARFALCDLCGMQLVTASGETVGVVIETQETPAGGLMRLQCAGAAMATAPVTEAFIVAIDTAANRVVVNDPMPFLVMDDSGRKRKAQDSA